MPKQLIRSKGFLAISRIVIIAFVFLFLAPLIVLAIKFPSHWVIDWRELFWATKNSILQAALSSFLTIGFGIFCCQGLIYLNRPRLVRIKKIIEVGILVPGFLPPLFSILSLLNIIEPFPMGLWGIAIVHCWMFAGLFAVIISRHILEQIGGYLEVAQVMGASSWMANWKITWPLIFKEIVWVSIYVFICSFASFSVPLAVGGGRGTTIEVLIYEKTRISLDWGASIILASIQCLFLSGFSFVNSKSKIINLKRRTDLSYFGSSIGLFFLAIIIGTFVVGFLTGVFEGLLRFNYLFEVSSNFLKLFFGSFITSTLVAIFCYISLMLIAYYSPNKFLIKFFSGYTAPSTALTGFAFLLLPGSNIFWQLIKISIGIFIILFASVFRLGWQTEMEISRKYYEQAEIFGASRSDIFKKITWPMMHHRAEFLSGLALIWAFGDFSIARIVGSQSLTLAMLADNLRESYRLGLASVVFFLLMLCSGLCWLNWKGVMGVLGRKLKSDL